MLERYVVKTKYGYLKFVNFIENGFTDDVNDAAMFVLREVAESYANDIGDSVVEVVEVIKKELRLYVWTGFCPDNTNGLAFAIAESKTEAKKMISDSMPYVPYEWGKLEILPLTSKISFYVAGGG